MRFLIFIVSLACLSSCTTTYYVVRHAEKEIIPGESDPDLTAAGAQRAQDLWTFLQDKGIDSVFVTQYKRTQQTAQPTATGSGNSLIEMDAGNVSALVNTLKRMPRNKQILIVGHSNTTPQLVDGLMESPQGIMINDATEFDNLFIVKIKHENPKKRNLQKLKYGQPSL